MNDIVLTTVEDYKRNLTFRFFMSGVVAIIIITLLITASGYYLLRMYGQQVSIERNLERVSFHLKEYNSRVNRDLQSAQQAKNFQVLSMKIVGMDGLNKVSFYNADKSLRWSSKPQSRLNDLQQKQFSNVLSGKIFAPKFDQNAFKLSTWKPLFSKLDVSNIPVMMPWTDSSDGKTGVIKVDVDIHSALIVTRQLVRNLFVIVLIGSILLFIFLYFIFRRGVKTIEQQGEKLNQQIVRLSNLLSVNKSMQKSMRTASSRAVELNEQFLRRVGSDLHDGPAQSIGYAVLRLDKLMQHEDVRQLSHEFHIIKEALDSSIEEVRAISSGLVMPELEGMTLEESIRKVVIRHQSNAKVEVTQYYQDIPEDIPLPIRICAFRFVQEGLNNAHKHGQAEKCRVTAQFKEGVLHLSLKDNGMGFRKSQLGADGGHLGLMGLRDRVESLGGQFVINSELGVGTALKISIAVTE